MQWEEEVKTNEWIFLMLRDGNVQRLHCEDQNALELWDATNKKVQWRLVEASDGWVYVENRR